MTSALGWDQLHLQYICFSSGSDTFVWPNEFLNFTEPPFSSLQPSLPFLPCSAHPHFHHLSTLFITLFSEASATAHSFPSMWSFFLLHSASRCHSPFSPFWSLCFSIMLCLSACFSLPHCITVPRLPTHRSSQTLLPMSSLLPSLPLGNGLLPVC